MSDSEPSTATMVPELGNSSKTVQTATDNYNVVQPKSSSPLVTNLASSPSITLPLNLITNPTATKFDSAQPTPAQNTVPRKPNYVPPPQNLAERPFHS